jgi:hypothetical protein
MFIASLLIREEYYLVELDTACILEASNPHKLGSRGDAELLQLLK